jgi:DNA-binding beta-propeller fold protein YncE
VVNTVARTIDGQTLVIVSPLWTGNGFASRIEFCDATTGALSTVITGVTMLPEGETWSAQHIEPYLSPDGRLLALARMEYDSIDPPTSASPPGLPQPKTGITDITYRWAIEVIDLVARTTLGAVNFASIPGNQPSGEHLAWAPDSNSIFAFSRRYVSQGFQLMVTNCNVDGTSPQLVSSVNSILKPDTYAAFNGPVRFPQRITPDRTMLVRYTPGRLAWYFLTPWAPIQMIDRPSPSALGMPPPSEYALFTATGDRVFLANPATGAVAAFDTLSRASIGSLQLPRLAGQTGNIPQNDHPSVHRNALALSIDEKTLYVVDARGSTGGVWAVDTQALQPVGTLFDGHLMTSVAVAPDGASLYGLSCLENQLYCTATSGISSSNARGAFDLVRPGSIASGE